MRFLIPFLVFTGTVIFAQFTQRSGKGKYSEDSGKYSPDNSGKYQHDNSGGYDPDYSGQYIPDDSGKYEHDDSGKYLPDYTGQYVTDKTGKYSYDEVLRQNKAKQIRKTRSISSLPNELLRNQVSKPANIYLPSADKQDNKIFDFVPLNTINNNNITSTSHTKIPYFNYDPGTKQFLDIGATKKDSQGTKFVDKPNTVSETNFHTFGKTLPRYPKLEELLQPTIRKLMGFGFSLIYNKLNKSHVVVNFGPTQNISQRLIPKATLKTL